MSLKDKVADTSAYKGKITSLLGDLPKGPLRNSSTPSINDTFSKGRYQDYVLDTDKVIDTTGGDQITQK